MSTPGIARLRDELLAAEHRLHARRRARQRRTTLAAAAALSVAFAGIAAAGNPLELVTRDGKHHALHPGQVFAMKPGDTLNIGSWTGLLGCAPARVKVDETGRSVTATGRSIVFTHPSLHPSATHPACRASSTFRSLVEPEP
jgi:hypothetical protein